MRYIVPALILCLTTGVHATEFKHRVRDGEQLEKIAKHYYGAAWKVAYLEARNATATSPKKGTRIFIPSSWEYTVRRGDSFAAIAKRHLGGTHRYRALMAFNNIGKPSDLAVGSRLLMPFHLSHVVAKGESYTALSRRYYRTTDHSRTLKDYNEVAQLRPGQKLIIPIFDRETINPASRGRLPKTVDEIVVAPPPPPKKEEVIDDASYAQRLRKAIRQYRKGFIHDACEELEKLLDTRHNDEMLRRGTIRQLGFCAVAHNDPEAAVDYFSKWIEMNPKASLDQTQTSPKVLKQFARARERLPANQLE
jgi:LysM repeat protein